MILTAILYTISLLLRFLCLLLPAYSLPTEAISALTGLSANMMIWNQFFPVTTLLTILVIIISYKIALLVFRLSAGVISLARGGGDIHV